MPVLRSEGRASIERSSPYRRPRAAGAPSTPPVARTSAIAPSTCTGTGAGTGARELVERFVQWQQPHAWKQLEEAELLPGRSAGACEEQWRKLNPTAEKRKGWSPEELVKLQTLADQHDRDWVMVAALIVYGVLWAAPEDRLTLIPWVLLACVSGAATYIATSALLRVNEFGGLLDAVRRRGTRT